MILEGRIEKLEQLYRASQGNGYSLELITRAYLGCYKKREVLMADINLFCEGGGTHVSCIISRDQNKT